MNKVILYWISKILLMALGAFFIIFGGFDDSPGLQGIGLLLIIVIVVSAIRNKRRKQ